MPVLQGYQGRKSRSGSDLNSDELAEILCAYPHALRLQIQSIRTGLKRRQLQGAHPCAKACVEVLRNVLGSSSQAKNARDMLRVVRLVGKDLASMAPAELTVGNITRRVLFMIREEYNTKKRAAEAAAQLLQGQPDQDFPYPNPNLGIGLPSPSASPPKAPGVISYPGGLHITRQPSFGGGGACGPNSPFGMSGSSNSGGETGTGSSSSRSSSGSGGSSHGGAVGDMPTPPRHPLGTCNSFSNLNVFLDRRCALTLTPTLP